MLILYKVKQLAWVCLSDKFKRTNLKACCKLSNNILRFFFAKCFFKQFGMRPNDYIKSLERAAPGDGAEF